MKKLKNILLILFISITLIFGCYQLNVSADSGFDSSYSSGGGSYSGGSSFGGSDYSYSGGGHYRSGSDSRAVSIIDFMLLFAAIILLIRANKVKKKQRELEIENSFEKKYISNEQFSNIMNGMSKQEFGKLAFDIYKDVQIAWMNFDYDSLQNNLTNEMFNMYKMQLDTLKVKNQKNIMEDITYYKVDIVNIDKNENTTSIKISLTVFCKDYIIDTQNNEVVRGNKDFVWEYTYHLTLIKNNQVSNEITCPNCGSKVDLNATKVCEYCKSTIVSDTHDWILSKKEMISQKRKR